MFFSIIILACIVFINRRLKLIISVNGYKVYNQKHLKIKQFKLKHIFVRSKLETFYLSNMNLSTIEYIAKKIKNSNLILNEKKFYLSQGLGPFEAQYMHKIDSQYVIYSKIIKYFPLIYFLIPKKKNPIEFINNPDLVEYFNHFYKNLNILNNEI